MFPWRSLHRSQEFVPGLRGEARGHGESSFSRSAALAFRVLQRVDGRSDVGVTDLD